MASAILNNVWLLVYPLTTGNEVPEIINIGSVTASSILGLFIGGFVYFVLHRLTKKGTFIFITAGVVFTFLSLMGPINMTDLPDGNSAPEGFALLTIPMHLIAGLAAIIITPKWVNRK
ncbi:MAG: hypothetical protein ABR88_03195 [Cryomorphaceae bacterium BACL7 MAG-120322-bin74]|nr:MAG: hypothetical protein ABR88_03195 [Cryomorphaceae bacterium BACL7 MAG-120322-bin74]